MLAGSRAHATGVESGSAWSSPPPFQAFGRLPRFGSLTSASLVAQLRKLASFGNFAHLPLLTGLAYFAGLSWFSELTGLTRRTYLGRGGRGQ